MRYGIFSDIHANVEAFKVVLESLENENIDQYVFAGDIVGYGAQPKECIKILQKLIEEKKCICVAGNHDYAVCGKSADDNYTRHAKDAVDWTKKQIDQKDKEFLAQMPLIQKTEDLTVVHANLETPDSWNYIFDIDDAHPNFKLLKTQVCFIGHSHKPLMFISGQTVNWVVQDQIDILKDTEYIINVGSVGQPRDGNPKASYAIYDTSTAIVEIKRVNYDVQKVQQEILHAGLPTILAERLSIGK